MVRYEARLTEQQYDELKANLGFVIEVGNAVERRIAKSALMKMGGYWKGNFMGKEQIFFPKKEADLIKSLKSTFEAEYSVVGPVR